MQYYNIYVRYHNEGNIKIATVFFENSKEMLFIQVN